MEEPDADTLAGVALRCPSVAALSGGLFGEVATYLPGRRVTGVRVDPDSVEVHVIARYGPPMGEVATEVRTALAPLAGGRAVSVVIDDLTLPGEPDLAIGSSPDG